MGFDLAMPDFLDDALRTLGHRLGLAPDGQVLCLLLTSAAQMYEDLVPTVYRLGILAQLTGASVWVRCFDVHLCGEIRPLDELVRALQAVDPGEGRWDDHRFRTHVGLLLRGRGGDDPAQALTEAYTQHATLPNGRSMDRVLLVLDGWSGVPTPPGTPSDHRLPTAALLTQQLATGDFDEELRFARLQPRLPWAPVVRESLLATLMEQHELRQTLATVAAEALNPIAATARARPRL